MSNFPAGTDVLVNPLSTDVTSVVDHAANHTNANGAIMAVQSNMGTNSGTNIHKNFVAGNFPARISSTGVLQQNISGTVNNSIFGTPAITGGTATNSTFNNGTLGTPASVGGTINSATLGTPAITGGTWTTPIFQGNIDGWIAATDTWVYASASTFTISGVDRTAIFTKGSRVKFTNNAITVYGIVASSAFSTNTTVTLIANSDYSIANSAITAPFYSYQANPQGYPGWFTYATTWTGFSPAPTYPFKFAASGNTCFVTQNTGAGADGTSNSTLTTFTLPVNTINGNFGYQAVFGKDNGANLTTPASIEFVAGTNIVNAYKTFYNGAWTNTAVKAVFFGMITYQF